ncbi:MAG: hypothetical protein WAW90_01440, partial [Minisyncoccia bacterium]
TSGIILISLAKYTEKQLSGSTVLVIVLAIAGGILIALSIVAMVLSAVIALRSEFLYKRNGHPTSETYEEYLAGGKDGGLWVFKRLNPIVIVPFSIWMCTRWLWMNRSIIANTSVSVIRFIGKESRSFVTRIFFYVHTSARRIALTDTFICTLIGTSLGSAFVGMIIGAVMSGIDYYFISVRLLNLIPAKEECAT